MAKAREIRRRIRSIRNTMQLTKAMKMVAAAKLRRSQDRIVRARPYARRMLEVLRSLAARANAEEHPLLQVRPERRVGLIVIGADRGLCGSFNTNVNKAGLGFLLEHSSAQATMQTVGRKPREYFRRRGYAIAKELVDVSRTLGFEQAEEIADAFIDLYMDEKLDAVYIAYNEFKSAIQQRAVVERLLPIEPAEFKAGESVEDYIYEPNAKELFAKLLPQFVEVQVYRALLESNAAEQAARMTAMESATSNAGDLIESLTLRMNRVRQATITTEIIEVVSGAAALG